MVGEASDMRTRPFRRGIGVGMYARGRFFEIMATATREAPAMKARDLQRDLREEQARSDGVAEGPVVVTTLGNSSRAKGP